MSNIGFRYAHQTTEAVAVSDDTHHVAHEAELAIIYRQHIRHQLIQLVDDWLHKRHIAQWSSLADKADVLRDMYSR